MLSRIIVCSIALVCFLSSTQGFWIWNKPKPTAAAQTVQTPVIIVPGNGGSQLQAKLNKTEKPHWYCSKKTDEYFTLWLKKSSLLPLAINCFADNMRLVYDEKTNTVHNTPGVETRVLGFGNTDTIEYLDTDRLVKYFAPMVDALVSWGYERGVTVRAAPYDFRYAPGPNMEYFTNLAQLIEETYSANENKKITLLTHSLGCPYTLYFLNHQTQKWKDKYILKWITLSGVWGGTAETVSLYSSGNTFDIPQFLVHPLDVRGEQRSATSNAWLLPNKDLWSKDEVLVTTTKRTYTVSDYEDFFNDISYPVGLKLRHMVENLINPLVEHAPNVTLHCLYGIGVDTKASFTFREGGFPDTQPKAANGDGDGTVNRRSLEACHRWIQRQYYNVTLRSYPSVDHNGMLSNAKVQSYLRSLIFEQGQ